MSLDVSTNNVLQYLRPYLILYKVRGNIYSKEVK